MLDIFVNFHNLEKILLDKHGFLLKLPTRQAVSSLRETLERQKAEKRTPDLVVEPAILTQPEPSSTPMPRRGMADRLAIAGGTTGGGAMWGAGIGACVAGPFGAAAGAGVGALAGAVVGLVSMVVD